MDEDFGESASFHKLCDALDGEVFDPRALCWGKHRIYRVDHNTEVRKEKAKTSWLEDLNELLFAFCRQLDCRFLPRFLVLGLGLSGVWKNNFWTGTRGTEISAYLQKFRVGCLTKFLRRETSKVLNMR